METELTLSLDSPAMLADVSQLEIGCESASGLTERYRPQTIDAFVGLEKPKAFARNLVAKPRPSAWLFKGPSGTGKTTLALTICASLPAELHHIPSQECTVDRIAQVRKQCEYVAHNPHDLRIAYKWHFVLIDEIHLISPQAATSLLSKLDATNFFPNTVVIGTCTDTERLDVALLSLFHTIDFSSYGISAPVSELLRSIWRKEKPDAQEPNFARIVKDASNNVRASLMALETEMMCC